MRGLEESIDRAADDRAGARDVVRGAKARTPLRRCRQHSCAIGPNAEVERETATELNRVLDVHSKERRLRPVPEDERIVGVMGQCPFAESLR